MRRLAAAILLALVAGACGDRFVAAARTSSATGSVSATAVTASRGPGIIVTPLPSGAATPTPVVIVPPTPSPTLTPAASGALTLAQLKYRVVDRFGRLWYC